MYYYSIRTPKLIFIATLSIVFANTLFSQQVIPNSKITISTNDSTQIAYININKANDVKPNSQKTYSYYERNKIHHLQGGYSGYLLNGKYERKDNQGNLIIQGAYKEGLKTGTWKYWNNDGLLAKTIKWQHGLKSGYEEIYNERGKLIARNKYKKGALHGKSNTYLDGETISTKKYKNGKEKVKKEKKVKPD